MDSRQQFEEWVVGRKVVKKHGAKLNTASDGTYCDYRINDRWLAWQASRESLAIELEPPNNDYENYTDREVSGACKYYEQAKKHIHAAGIRTK